MQQNGRSISAYDAEAREVLARGSVLSPRKSGSDEIPEITFSGLFAALLVSRNAWSLWAKDRAERMGMPGAKSIASGNGLDAYQYVAAAANKRYTLRSEPKFHPSVAHFVDAAHALRAQVEGGDVLGVRHLFGALIYDPAGHESDLSRWSFDAEDWGRAFVQAVRERAPNEAPQWERIHADRFHESVPPSAPNPGSTSALVGSELPLNQNAERALRTAVELQRALDISGPIGVPALLSAIIGRFAVKNTFGLSAGQRLSELGGIEDVEAALGEFGSRARTKTVARLSPETLSREEFDPEVRAILDRAVNAAQRTWRESDGNPRIAVRHLVAATFTGEAGPELKAFLAAAGITRARAIRALRDLLLIGNAFEAGRGWEDIWIIGPGVSGPRDLPGYVPDHVPDDIPQDPAEARQIATDDRLEILDDVDALCSVIADKDARPPLAIGLFGGWGSGKSFFMRQMRAEIATRASEARAELADEKPPRFCTNVAQVSFNAWHYMDANLWASLAHRIFEGLEQLDHRSKARDLAEELASAQGAAKAAAARHEAARDAANKAKEQVVVKEKEKAKLAADLTVLGTVVARSIGQSERVHQELEAAAERLKVPKDGLSPTDLHGDVREVVKTLGGVRGLVLRGLSTRTTVLAAVGVLAVVAVALALRSSLPAWLWAFVPAPAVGDIVRRFKLAHATVDDAVAHLRRAQDAAQEAQSEAEADERQRLAEVRASLERATADAEEARAADARAQAHLAQVEAEQADIRDGRQLLSFVKSAGAGYHEELGIISRLRAHLEELARLFHARGKANPGATYRFVLYIDDLDRCPAKRVVEVLQAVHLLLAFPLFVVVVGVDARWLVASLRRHDRGQLAEREIDTSWGSRPMDYLEKIFQIPFVLRPMPKDRFGALMTSLVPSVVAPVTDRGGEQIATSDGEPVVVDVDPGAPEKASPGGPRDTADGTDPAPGGSKDHGAAPPARRSRSDVQITTAEREAMARLAPLLTTPRAANRFANVYRIVRTSAANDEFGVATRPGDIAAVQLLVAAACGHVMSAGRLFAEIERFAGHSWRQFARQLEDPAKPKGKASRVDGASKSQAEDKAWRRLADAVVAVGGDGGPEPSVLAMQEWVDRVRRFSFEELRG